MRPELFERLAEQAFEADRVRMEMFNGKVWVHKATDGAHAGTLSWMTREFVAHRPDLDFMTSGLGLKVDTCRKGRVRPDAVIAPAGYFDDAGEWADSEGVLAVAEVTSWDADTHARDRVEKPAAYAETGIGLYLLVDNIPGSARSCRVRPRASSGGRSSTRARSTSASSGTGTRTSRRWGAPTRSTSWPPRRPFSRASTG
jgi:hypothetical protein